MLDHQTWTFLHNLGYWVGWASIPLIIIIGAVSVVTWLNRTDEEIDSDKWLFYNHRMTFWWKVLTVNIIIFVVGWSIPSPDHDIQVRTITRTQIQRVNIPLRTITRTVERRVEVPHRFEDLFNICMGGQASVGTGDANMIVQISEIYRQKSLSCATFAQQQATREIEETR